jgi:hypothetical protein
MSKRITRHVVSYSGGAGSWCAAKRVAEAHGIDNMVLLFADTNMEDEDLYRFLDDSAENIGMPITRITDGRTPWDVFKDKRFLGNSRVDPCSAVLKRDLIRKWLSDNCDPISTVVYIGIDWTEAHRIERIQAREDVWRYEAPMCSAPYLSKTDMITWMRRDGIQPPRLYSMGFPHNNCGGFCVKAGQAQFAKLLREMPERYAEHEAAEQGLREFLGKDVAIMRDRTGGETRPITMAEFRQRVEANDYDQFDWGGCGCAIDMDAEEEPWRRGKT